MSSRIALDPIINAQGAHSDVCGTLVSKAVERAVRRAMSLSISSAELQAVVCPRVAAAFHADAALVTSGCAAAITCATAGCITGLDADLVSRVPAYGLQAQREAIMLRGHRMGYDHALRNAGVTIVDADSEDDVRRLVSPRTALLFFVCKHTANGAVSAPAFAAIAKAAGVPAMVDAAADWPPIERVREYLAMGFDLAALSGDKGLSGPHCSGLLVVRQPLVAAAALNAPPNPDALGRIAEVSRSQILGLACAVDEFLRTDQRARWKTWCRRVTTILRAVSGIAGIEGELFVPDDEAQVPHARVTWQPEVTGVTKRQALEMFLGRRPRIRIRETDVNEPSMEFAVWSLKPGEDRVIADRCAATFGRRARGRVRRAIRR